ncbi:MAG TPA: efflux RND transporter permease subunit [Solirubrobacteraceae bacterium]|nr:efflux RND transporter permease subunit [Solirubrobacteraceae bacterium]
MQENAEMRAILRFALTFRVLIVALAAGTLAVGVTQLDGAPVDVLPEFTPPYAEIQTEALGLSAEEVEELITVPLEADLLNGVEGVDVIRSQSLPSLSSIVLVFKPGTDVYRARQLVQERLIQAHALPNVSSPPTLLQPLSSSSRVLMIGLSSEQLSPIEKSVIARWTLRPRLMGVPGVANVSVWGMRDQQLQVQVDPEQLRDRDVTLNQVVKTAGNAQAVSPLTFLEASTPGTGGFIETPQQRLQVRNVLEQLADPDELAKVPVEGTGGRLRLSDVADVKVDHQPLIGDAVVDGGDGLLLVVEKFPGAGTTEVTAAVEDALETLRPGLSGLQTDTSVFRPATFIEDAKANLELAIFIAAALVALAFAALLFRLRTVLIGLFTIPVSLVAAALVLDALGETFNAISFAGLMAGVALVVDEAVVGVENVARRLHDRRAAGSDVPTSTVVLEASQEVRGPLMYATLIALLAIVPVVAMEGRPGAFFEPLVLAYALAVVAALVVALTLTPALCALLLSRGRLGRRESPLLTWLRPRYERAFTRFARRPGTGFVAAGALLLAGLAALPFMGTSPIPSLKDRDVLVHLEAEPGTSNPRMTQIATSLTRELRSLPGIDNVGAHVGRAVTGDETVDVNSGEVWVSVASGADYDDTVDNIEDAVGRVPGVQREVVTYSAQKIRDVGGLNDGDNPVRGDGLDVLTGAAAPLVVRVYGEDLATLRRQAEAVRRLLSDVDGVVNPRVEQVKQQPTLEIEADLAKAQRLGVKPGDVRRAEATLLQGIQVGSVFEDQKVFDVVVKGVPGTRQSLEDVGDLLIDRPGGGHVRLGDVADVRVVPKPIAIERDAVSRRIDVQAGVSGRSLGAVADDVRARLASTKLPLAYHAEVLESTTGEEIGAIGMLAFAVGALLAAYLLLQAAFGSWRLAALVCLMLPVALAGGVIAALLAGAELSLGSMLGLLALLGLAARTSVLLVRHFQDRPADERAAGERLVPIVTTAAALLLLMLPFVLLGTRPGLEVVHPMAVVILGGLFTATFVSLFLLPATYARVAVAAAPGTPIVGPVVRQRTAAEPEVVRVAGDGDGAPDGNGTPDGNGDGRPARDGETER